MLEALFNRTLRIGYHLLRYQGVRWTAYRLKYGIQSRIGWLQKKMPTKKWVDQPLFNFLQDHKLASSEVYASYRKTCGPPFFFSSHNRQDQRNIFTLWDLEGTETRTAEDVRDGIFTYFGCTLLNLGLSPDWHANPFTNQKAPKDCHWSRINDLEFGDIKVTWEPNRFSFVYALVRAYWRTGDESYAECFWQLVEGWLKQNPPQSGVNWKCGQEISFRVMAWLFGLYGFLESPATTAERVAALAQMVAVSAKRIEANLDYALSQHNNHGISEGVGLWTIGLIFPEFRQSAKWRELGRQVLEQTGRELIYDDGSFSQHSVNYHRLMLHDFLWAIRLGDLNGQPLNSALRERVAKACNWLFQIQDKTSGRAPNYGHNDGALVLPLNNCDYRDFRPVIQAVHYLCFGTRCYPPGPWDEDVLWLFGPDALESPIAPPERTSLKANQGGYYTLRSTEGFALVRCATFKHRPGQADLLHMDLWWRGQNVALDAGTYSYNAPAPWNNSLAHTAYHNTVTVDGLDQMDRVGKFLWLPWLKGRVTRFEHSDEGSFAYWEGEHDGYKRLKYPVSHQRAILQLPNENWVILDKLESIGQHRYRLHWLLMDVPYEWDERRWRLTLHTEAGPLSVQMGVAAEGLEASLVRADSSAAQGWHSPYYYYREPALSLAISAASTSCCFWTVFGPDADVSLDSIRCNKTVDKVFKTFFPS